MVEEEGEKEPYVPSPYEVDPAYLPEEKPNPYEPYPPPDEHPTYEVGK